jgi:hypothetical protein
MLDGKCDYFRNVMDVGGSSLVLQQLMRVKIHSLKQNIMGNRDFLNFKPENDIFFYFSFSIVFDNN